MLLDKRRTGETGGTCGSGERILDCGLDTSCKLAPAGVRAARARRELVGGIGVLKKIIINH